MNRPAHVELPGEREVHAMCARCGKRPVPAPEVVCAGCVAAAPGKDVAGGDEQPERLVRRSGGRPDIHG